MPQTRSVDESFLALPLSAYTDAALTRAVDLSLTPPESGTTWPFSFQLPLYVGPTFDGKVFRNSCTLEVHAQGWLFDKVGLVAREIGHEHRGGGWSHPKLPLDWRGS